MNKLLKAFNIEPGEAKAVALLLTQSFFIGIFFITLSVCAETLFLQNFNKSEIGKAYALSGVAGILLTGLYSKLQSVISFSKLSMINQLTIGLILFFAWIGFGFVDQKILIFGLFALMGPLYIVALVNFGGLLLRMFTLRQGKRLFSLVDSGAVFGTIIMGFLTPVLISILPNTKDLLVISFCSMGMVFVFQTFISGSFSENLKDKSNNEIDDIEIDKKEKVNSTKLLFTNKYIRAMALFTVITMVSLFLIQFMFLSSTSAMYPEENDLAGFLGSFTASMMIFSFLIKTFVYSKLIKNYGLKIAFVILPAVLVLFSLAAIVAGHAFTYENTSFEFVYFFLLISLSKLFSVALKDAIQTPSFKVLYQSLDISFRFDIQAKVDGIVNEIAATLSGVLLAGLGMLTFLDLIHYGYFTAVLCIVWSFFAIKLYNEYKDSLQSSLESIKDDGSFTKSETKENFTTLALKEKNDNTKLLASIYEPIYSTDKLAVNSFSNQALSEISRLNEISTDDIETISKALKNSDISIRIEAARLINQFKIEALYFQLADNIPLNSMKNCIEEIFNNIGQSGVSTLHQSFYKTGLNTEDLIFIVKLIGSIKSEKSIPFLEKNIDYPDYEVAKTILKALKELNYQAKDNFSIKVHQLIDESIQNIGWNIGALDKIEIVENVSVEMKKALAAEIENGKELLYLQLSTVYDAKSIQHIKENINSGVTESIGFAIELLDLFVIDELKPKLFPLLEDTPVDQKLDELRQNFAIHLGSTEEILKDIINKDYNLTNTYTKACALRNLAEISEDITIDIIANLFNPNTLIREVALFSILNNSPEKYFQIKQRLPKDLLIEFETKKLKLEKNINHLLLNKIEFLKNVTEFSFLSHESLEKLANCSDIRNYNEKITKNYTSYGFNLQLGNLETNFSQNEEYLLFDKDQLTKTMLTDRDIGKSLYQLSLNNNLITIAA